MRVCAREGEGKGRKRGEGGGRRGVSLISVKVKAGNAEAAMASCQDGSVNSPSSYNPRHSSFI